MKRIIMTLSKIVTTVAFVAVATFGVAQPIFAATGTGISNTNAQALCTGSGGTWNGTGCDNPDGSSVTGTIKNITNLLLFVLGAIAVVMVIVGGIRYATSAGDATAVKGAKDTIMYSIIGLVVAFAAYAIVNFVTSKL
jgi:type IV secretory pathway VirB2 component (pilin)